MQGKSKVQRKVQLFFSSCLVDVSVAVIGPSCLSLVMVQGMRLLSRLSWWWWWWFTWIKNVIKNVKKNGVEWNPRWFKKTVPREDGNKKTVTSRTAQRQHHNINYRIQRQQRQHETTTNSCSLTVGTWKLNVLPTKKTVLSFRTTCQTSGSKWSATTTNTPPIKNTTPTTTQTNASGFFFDLLCGVEKHRLFCLNVFFSVAKGTKPHVF